MKWLKAVVLTAAAIMASIVDGNLVMKVENKFKMISRERKVNLTELKAHDDLRRGRFLSAVDIPMGGNGYPTDAGYAFPFPLTSSFWASVSGPHIGPLYWAVL